MATDRVEHNAVKWSGTKLLIWILWHFLYVGSVGTKFKKIWSRLLFSFGENLLNSEGEQMCCGQTQSCSISAALGRMSLREDLN